MEPEENGNDDPRLGTGSESSSLDLLLESAFVPVVITVVPVLAYQLACSALFLFLRRKYPRVYATRTIPGIISPARLIPELPNGWFDWFKPFLRVPDSFVINECSLDGFLFLRLLKVLCIICLVGICFVCPILLPINRGGKYEPFALTICNVPSSEYYWAHVVASWLFLGFVLFVVYRECLYYVNFRFAHLVSSGYTSLPSSKTVLFTGVPPEYHDKAQIRKLFGDSAIEVSIPKETKELRKRVKQRSNIASQLEKAEITLIKRANATREKTRLSHEKQGQDDQEVQPAESAVSNHDRPTHRILAEFGRRVDTIEWARSRLRVLQDQIDDLTTKYHTGDGSRIHAAFVEFDTYANAQTAYQTLAHHQPLSMSKPVMCPRPGEIIWSALPLKGWKLLIRQHLISVVILVGITLWWVPFRLVGFFLDGSVLRHYVPFLDVDGGLPMVTRNLISGLLRAIVVCLLMALVPAFLRVCARLSGMRTVSMVELFVNDRHFIFQALQLFLAPGLFSSIAGLFAIIQSPYFILTSQIPKLSIFFYSYVLVRCLQSSADDLVQVIELFQHQVRARWSTRPRSCFERWRAPSVVLWGGIYPVFTNLGVIAIFYACVAPLILVFTMVGLGFVYCTYRYNLLYVYDTKTLDTNGRFYPRAILNLMVGVYFAEIYLIALFAVKGAPGQLALMALLLFISFLAIKPLLHRFPRSLNSVGEGLESLSAVDLSMDNEATAFLERHNAGRNVDTATSEATSASGGSEPATPAGSLTNKSTTRTFALEDEESRLSRSSTAVQSRARSTLSRLTGWFRAETYQDFRSFQHLFFDTPMEEDFPKRYAAQRYCPPETWLPKPKLWIPRDGALVSQQEVAETSKVIPITDEACWLDGKTRVQFDLANAPFEDDGPIFRLMRLVVDEYQ
ncbi:hypothetical protein B0T10DRAFT_536687 [Thelonectria olida]|uniref:Uncharacterized protein n=1 Tax=Thelonectria olida TaxID=1576542 RepID=A0A9P8WEC1_9HYPO|nr:hypothetical protein B0T10DRAFT_536687 [Thelonectria olida]